MPAWLLSSFHPHGTAIIVCLQVSHPGRKLTGPSLFPFLSTPQKYIAQVLQDSPPDGDMAESEEQGSQDEDLINPNGINDTDFQSCEDSLIENEVHH